LSAVNIKTVKNAQILISAEEEQFCFTNIWSVETGSSGPGRRLSHPFCKQIRIQRSCNIRQISSENRNSKLRHTVF